MAEAAEITPGSQGNSSHRALAFVHTLLTRNEVSSSLAELLSELARAFGAAGAGLASLPGYTILAHSSTRRKCTSNNHWPWQANPSLLSALQQARTAVGVPSPDGGSWLVTALTTQEREGWLLWIEEESTTGRDGGEAAALFLAGQAIVRWLAVPSGRPRWAQQLERFLRQQQLDHGARVARRIAHDYGNLLTGILGFTELALGLPLPAGTPLPSYLGEVQRSAQAGAQLTQQLRQLGRRTVTGSPSCKLEAVLAEEEARLRASSASSIRITVSAANDLPGLAISNDSLRQVLAILLDNAREAIQGVSLQPGRASSLPITPSRTVAHEIGISARAVEVGEAQCLDYYGDVRSGAHVEITITDSGCGLSPEAAQRLFHEPFYSSKPRRRGLGLTLAYSILASNRSGLQLTPGPQCGTQVQVVVPATDSAAAGSRTRILVVDDDPMILKFVSTTLEQAGFQVQAAECAEAALHASRAAAQERPFDLVLADVLMPGMNGLDLAQHLREENSQVRVLFMSGQAAQDVGPAEMQELRLDILSKPFRPEGLLRAVRGALQSAAAMT